MYGNLDSTKWIPDSRFLDPGFPVCGTWISDTNPQWDFGFLSCILDFKAQDSRFYKQKFPGFWIPQAKSLGLRNPNSLTSVEKH